MVVLFLTLFAIFSLVPPLYMLITSLQGPSAEISAATKSLVGVSPDAGELYFAADLEPVSEVFLEFRVVSIIVVTITMLISVPAAFALFAHAVSGARRRWRPAFPHVPGS